MTHLSIDDYPEGIMIIDIGTLQIQNINTRAAELFGIPKEKITEARLTDLLPESASGLTAGSPEPLIHRLSGTPESRIVELILARRKADSTSQPIIVREVTHEHKTRRNLEKELQRCRLLNTEIHHRVKNSLAIISSLINLISENADDTGELFHLTSQVNAVAAVHQQLAQEPGTNRVDICSYLDTVARNALHAYGFEQVRPEINIDNLEIPAKTATSLGIMVNEIIINAIKYGFTPKTRFNARLWVNLSSRSCQDGTELILTIKNNGRFRDGCPDGSSSSGTGRALIDALLQELDARLTITRNPQPVFEIRLTIMDE